MGESLVEVPKVESKMGESVAYVPCFQQSVSFGRFERDSLCWERWSTFPANKYLEEVEKCSTPGSVAQKKAYFEAHYKRIAARKIELMEQERERESESEMLEDQNEMLRDSVSSTFEEGLNVGRSENQNSDGGEELENEGTGFTDEVNDVHIDVPHDVDDTINVENEEEIFTIEVSEHADEHGDGADEVVKHEDLEFEDEDVNVNLSPEMEIPESEKPEEAITQKEEDVCTKIIYEDKEEVFQDKAVEEPVCLKEEVAPPRVMQDKGESSEESKTAKKETNNLAKTQNPKKMQKAMPTKKMTPTTNTKKKLASPAPKRSAAVMPRSPMPSTPKSSKPMLSKSIMSTTRPSVKKENGLTPLTSKKVTKPETKRVLPTSLHMSLSLGPANSEPAAVTNARKSLIMEKMGDKDIVKRAFKAFQNFSHLTPSSLGKTPVKNKSAAEKIEKKGSASDSLQNKHGGTIKAVKPSSPHTAQQGTRKTSVSPGLPKTMDQRNGKPVPASFGFKNQDLGNKQKVGSKILEQKSKTKESGKTHPQSKVEKAASVKKLSQSVNSKASLSTSYNQGHGFLKALHKEDGKAEASR